MWQKRVRNLLITITILAVLAIYGFHVYTTNKTLNLHTAILADIQGTVSSVEDDVSSIQDNVYSIEEEKLTEIQDKIDEIEEKIDSIETDISFLE